jgi:hypothetical protein
MKIKANPQGHKRGVGEVRTRGYTDIGWRSGERGHAPPAARVKEPPFKGMPGARREHTGSGALQKD